MDCQGELEQLRASLRVAERVQRNLDQRIFHLKTLYDVSRDIFASVESDRIVRNFLLMTMGNFGVVEGFILIMETPVKEISSFVQVGLHETDLSSLKNSSRGFLLSGSPRWDASKDSFCLHPDFLPSEIVCALPFALDDDCMGLIGLGAKMIGEPFDEQDQELLHTLVNNLKVALKNARSFEEIERLNRYLQTQNVQLEKAYNRLSGAMRKVETLESIKTSLSKFVPVTVCRLIEKSPTTKILETKQQDVSVLFLDIEGYTKICEKLSAIDVNKVIEKCFSVIMEAIHANDGDINETAGDGLMVLFINEDKKTNALQAVQTAATIREKLADAGNDLSRLSKPLIVNIGVNSGAALVGAVKFESYTGSRWTYTARGMTTNIAARLGALASGGKVLLSESTAERVKDQFKPTFLGKFQLKNVSDEISVYEL